MSDYDRRPSFPCQLEAYRQNPQAYWREKAFLGCLACSNGPNVPQISIEPPYVGKQPITRINNPDFIGTTCPAGEPIPVSRTPERSRGNAQDGAGIVNKAAGIFGAVIFITGNALKEPLQTPAQVIGLGITVSSLAAWTFVRYSNNSHRT